MSSFSLPGRKGNDSAGRKLPLLQHLGLQFFCLLIAFTVLFPIMWIVSMSFDPRNIARPTELRLIPPGASLDAYLAVLDKPTSNPITFAALALNSFKLAAGVSLVAVLVGVSAAYAFSRFKFAGRQTLMIGVLAITVIPAVATIAPLFAMLNGIRVSTSLINVVFIAFGAVVLLFTGLIVWPNLRDGTLGLPMIGVGLAGALFGGYVISQGFTPDTGKPFVLRDSLLGVGIAMISGALPFAIWNLKGYLDTIPKELEEAAIIDGATPNQIFFQIVLPLAVPAIAVTGFLGFMGGWTEFFLSWQFLTKPQDFTLAMALWNMTGQYAGSVPWSKFAAMSIMVSLPVAIVYLALQRYIVGGLTLGGVKG
ncbi:ABC transporter permease subunit [Oscillochloris sp. ZM17-4]|uniref:sugar ABC transporter permease n=1 Tax=Oscillochloris sp. ZM17-4 TaxID=2866714 RepID=UPI001C732D87|nr:ABC transporter permease subunit [Oscillochloris sp. ZM17-4]MBX0331525.1 ABC transporter permease subunit [Oscillochloris sp. ZM17-4]